MSETTKDANEVITQILERALSGVDAAVEFSRDQIPDVVQQLLSWNFTISLIWFCVWCALALASVPFWVWFAKTVNVRSKADDAGFAFFCALVISTASSAGLLNSLAWLKIWIAPKLYMLEYGASLVK